MIIPTSADEQMERLFSVAIANCNNMHKRRFRFGDVDGCIWFEVPKPTSSVLIQMHILVADRQFMLYRRDLLTNVHNLGNGVTLRADYCHAGSKYTYSFEKWETFEVFLSRLPSSMPSGKITYIDSDDDSPLEVDYLINHLHQGTGRFSCVSTSSSALKKLRHQMRNFGVAA